MACGDVYKRQEEWDKQLDEETGELMNASEIAEGMEQMCIRDSSNTLRYMEDKTAQRNGSGSSVHSHSSVHRKMGKLL